jgi:hypothetical protein
MDVLHRRDQRDEPFRALLFSIGEYFGPPGDSLTVI